MHMVLLWINNTSLVRISGCTIQHRLTWDLGLLERINDCVGLGNIYHPAAFNRGTLVQM